MVGLASFLQHEADKRGWLMRELAIKAELPTSTLYKILNNPDQIPSLKTLAALASALEMPLSRLIATCGYDVHTIPPSQEDVDRNIQIVLSAVPEFRQFLEEMAGFSLDEQASVLAYIELLRRQKMNQTAG